MEAVTNSQKLVVWAEKGALAEAKDAFSRFDALFRTIPSASEVKDIPDSRFRFSICGTRSRKRSLNLF